MKIRILSGVILNGEPQSEGSIVEVTDAVGRQIVASNRAEAYAEPEPEPEPEPVKTTSTRTAK